MKIDWNVDPFKRGEVPIGEVQLWADMSEEEAKWIIELVKEHQDEFELYLKASKEIKSAMKVFDRFIEWIEK